MKVTLYVILMAVTLVLFIWMIDKQYMLITKISLGILWVLEIILLLHFVKRTNRDLAFFMESIRYGDDSLNFKVDNSTAFKPLYTQFNRILDELRKAKTEKDAEHHHFINVIKNVPAGMISIDHKGKVQTFNEAAANLLDVRDLKNLRDLNNVSEGLGHTMMKLESGDNRVFRIKVRNELLALLVKVVEFRIKDESIKLYSLQNITSELEEGEIEAWQKLIRVLSHEIVNSVSPISLLSYSLIQLMEKDGKQLDPKDVNRNLISSSLEGLKAIQKRSNGLKRFVESYKSITKIPEPNFVSVNIRELVQQVGLLMRKELEEGGIDFSFDITPKDLELTADEKLIEQVLINLIKNAIQAFKEEEERSITVEAYRVEANIRITITDNGPGILKEDLNNIFLPFFTTREDGSGIGLNLSKQIMRLHKGKLSVKSQPGRTVFTMVF